MNEPIGGAPDFLERVLARAESFPSTPALTAPGPDSTPQTLSWEALLRRTREAAAAFRRDGIRPGDRVVLCMPTGTRYVAALLGAMLAGAVPCTFARPSGGGSAAGAARELEMLCAEVTPVRVVGDEPWPALQARHIPTQALCSEEATASGRFRPVAAEQPCYVQFSSGSTGRPSAVVLTRAAVSANLEAISRRVPLRHEDHVVSWLPMYHDMGLFGTLLAPLHAGCRLTLVDSSTFVSNPLSWFRLLSETRATITATPPSALRACLDLLRRRPMRDLDLTSLRQVICGSEPVPERLLVEFEQVLGPLGVPARALKPVYGLAEATLAVSMPAQDAVPRLEHARGARVRTVGLGTPLDGVQVAIRGPDGASAAEREVGAVFVRGPSLLAGRLRRGKFRERRGEWLDTGDLGFLAHGELFITGRSKDLIIRGGRNLSPERIEEVACDAVDGRRAAAFGAYSERLGTERVVVILELPGGRIADAPARDQVRLAVRNAARDAGYPLDEVLLIRRGVLPRTSSGKIRRGEARSRYLSGCYREPGT